MRDIRILSASFISSTPKFDDAPDFGISEVAFLGRSNVGKSSLINALVNHHGLAKSSSTPGKTRLINFFNVIFEDDGIKVPIIFVDLPGFGYAKVSKSLQLQWQKYLDEFLKKRVSIKLFIHLIDARHGNLVEDENLELYINKFLKKDQKIIKLYTKADKLNQSQKHQILKFTKDALLVSSSKSKGIKEAISKIYDSTFGKDI